MIYVIVFVVVLNRFNTVSIVEGGSVKTLKCFLPSLGPPWLLHLCSPSKPAARSPERQWRAPGRTRLPSSTADSL